MAERLDGWAIECVRFAAAIIYLMNVVISRPSTLGHLRQVVAMMKAVRDVVLELLPDSGHKRTRMNLEYRAGEWLEVTRLCDMPRWKAVTWNKRKKGLNYDAIVSKLRGGAA